MDPAILPPPTVIAEELRECKKQGEGGNRMGSRRAEEHVKGMDSASPEAAPSQAEDAEFFSISDLCCSDRLLTM